MHGVASSLAARPPRRAAHAAHAPAARRARAHAVAPKKQQRTRNAMTARMRQLRAAAGEDGAGAPAAATAEVLHDDAVRSCERDT
jgi:hypothetical protein